MMMSLRLRNVAMLAVAGLAVAACNQNPPASNALAPVGYEGNFNAPAAIASGPISSGPIGTADLAAAGIGAAPIATTAGSVNPAPLAIQSSGISDEQEFGAVSTRETIESDAERLRQAAAAYQVIQPTALQAPTNAGPNIVEYALNAPNSRGQAYYSRFIFSGQGRFERNCAGYRSADEAQRDFLSRGGPERDSRGIDPDGDGFACGWDPAPFRAAVGR